MSIRLAFVLLGLIGFSSVAYAARGDAPAAAQASKMTLDVSKLRLGSANALVLDAQAGRAMYAKGADTVTPIASVTKLMTAMVVLDADQALDEPISIGIADLDLLKGSRSRLRLGSELSRREMLRLALMASENRAASSLARYYPGGTEAFVEAMNRKAQGLGMTRTRFAEPTGLSSENVSTARDLALMVKAAAGYELIREATTTASYDVEVQPTGEVLGFKNTNLLVRAGQWDIQVSKTGFIREAGRNLVLLANIASRPVIIVLLDSLSSLTRIGDALRVKYWLETGESLPAAKAVKVKRVKGTMRRTSGRPVPAKVKARG